MNKKNKLAVYKIEISRLYKTMILMGVLSEFCILLLSVFNLFSDSLLVEKVFLLLFPNSVLFIFMSIFWGKIIVRTDSISIYCGFVRKQIKFTEISSVYEAGENAYIERGNPAYSKNVVALEYQGNKRLYISIKEKSEFIRLMNRNIYRYSIDEF